MAFYLAMAAVMATALQTCPDSFRVSCEKTHISELAVNNSRSLEQASGMGLPEGFSLTDQMSDIVFPDNSSSTHQAELSDTIHTATKRPGLKDPSEVGQMTDPTTRDKQFAKKITPWLSPPSQVDHIFGPMGSTRPPWYLESAWSWPETNVTDSESLQKMLREIENSIEYYGTRYFTYVISGYELSATPELDSVMSQHNMCGQVEVRTRISCVGRCGRTSDTRTMPSQCACDTDCFLHSDCCEDMKQVCPEQFVEATVKMYAQYENFAGSMSCSMPHWPLLMSQISSTLAHASSPLEVTVLCEEGFFHTALQNSVVGALLYGYCSLEDASSFGNHLTYNRLCGRPEVLVCETNGANNFPTFYPVHLYCYQHPMTANLISRYANGFRGMEVVSRHGNCSYLLDSRNATGVQFEDPAASSETKTLYKLLFAKEPGEMALYLQDNETGSMRCTGGPANAEWKCSMNDCFEKRLLDNVSNTCYLPDRVSLQVFIYNSDLEQSKSGLTRSSQVGPCLCLKAQAVLSEARPWRFLFDSEAMQNGQCSLRIYHNAGSRTLDSNGTNSLTFNETANWQKEIDGESSDGPKHVFQGEGSDGQEDVVNGETESSGVRTGGTGAFNDSSTFTSFSARLRDLWRDRVSLCGEENFAAVQICFHNGTSIGAQSTCFLLPKEEAQVEEKPSVQADRASVGRICRSVSVETTALTLALLALFGR
ncbi:hypothetical protein EGW08_021220 [Elysia chlorotica]|uniref:SMB domain-containing protein n=1 Tax=Elysia chlorotica TaxID=188477 RepID=A0A3S1AZA3_ELYCH|nr:hypothetical protein EGW08_021220 [Elysia chlorotica]